MHLTQGYWKTHIDTFWGGAPTDETWELIGPLAENEIFFLSGMTYFDVMWVALKRNAFTSTSPTSTLLPS